jgi:hypothetical protein
MPPNGSSGRDSAGWLMTAEAVRRVVGQVDGLVVVLDEVNDGHRPEQLLVGAEHEVRGGEADHLVERVVPRLDGGDLL